MTDSFPILHTKLHIPRLRTNRILRARLTARLDEGLAGNLIVISAPAGSGKTTLLAEWIERRQRQEGRTGETDLGRPGATAPAEQFAWLGLDEADNDPMRFLAYLLASLRRVAPGLGEDLLEAVQSPQPPAIEAMMIGLLNDIAALPGRIILILDDYHTIRTQMIHDALAYLVEHLPQNLLLVIASRSDPPLPLTRLRARGQVVEARQEDLRFTVEEAVQFLNQAMGLALTFEQVGLLEQRTEGWAAGLQMAAVSLRGRDDINTFLDSFSGSHRFVLDYLLEEALANQPAEIQTFLLQTSILDRFCAPLCAAVIGAGLTSAGAQAILEQVERSNLFIIPLDDQRRWYRYHHLFAELLRQQLEATQSGATPGGAAQQELPSPAMLHRQASDWYAGQGLLPEAIEHCLAAQDFSAAANLIAGAAEEMLRYSEVATLQSWLEALPEEATLERPDLCFYHALALVIGWQSLERVNSRLQCALAGNVSGPLAAAAAALDGVIASFQGDYTRGAARSQQALAMLSEPDSFLGSLTISLLGLAYMFNGNIPWVHQSLAQALEISAKAGNLLTTSMLRSQMADLAVFEGRLHRGYELYQETLRQGVDRRGRPLPVAGMAYLGLGEIQREWNDLEAAETWVERGLELIRRWGEAAAIDGYVALAKIKQARGEAGAARAFIERAAASARQFDASDMDDRMVGAYAARVLAYQGDLDGARRWLEKAGVDLVAGPPIALRSLVEPGAEAADDNHFPNNFLQELEWTAASRLLLLLERPQAALETLRALSPAAQSGGRWRSSAEILILMSLAYVRLGDEALALRCLEQSVAIAAPEGYVRLFADEAAANSASGATLAMLLQRLRAQTGREIAEYIDRLLAALPPGPPTDVSPPANTSELLSARELEVLRCLADGMTNEEIAARLTVALSTVKSHVHNILNKLGASSRLAAVQSARELGLLK